MMVSWPSSIPAGIEMQAFQVGGMGRCIFSSTRNPEARVQCRISSHIRDEIGVFPLFLAPVAVSR